MNKAIWLSYDLGIGGDYPGLYKWLDNKNALECGNGIAFLRYPIAMDQIDSLTSIIKEDMNRSVSFRPGDRIYIVFMETTGGRQRVRGEFLFGRRKSNPWEGYDESKLSISEDGE